MPSAGSSGHVELRGLHVVEVCARTDVARERRERGMA